MKSPTIAFIAVILIAVTVGAFLANASKGRAPQPGTVAVEKDKLLAAAVYKAKLELPKFIKALKDHPEGEFAINGRFETPKGPEQIWVQVNIYRDGVFYGVIASPPVGLDKAKGDAVEVAEKDVSDWTYRVDGKTEGGFTAAVLKGR